MSASIYLCVVKILSWPSHIAIVEISTPDCKRFKATVWRNVCAEILFLFIEGTDSEAFSTRQFSLYRTPVFLLD